MPYIVTTKRPFTRLPLGGYSTSRRAVLTLNEAKATVWVAQADAEEFPEYAAVPESGVTVGPLPDGTLIDVQRVSFYELGEGRAMSEFATDEAVIEAFNNRAGSAHA